MVMSLAEFLERLEADPFDPKLFELVKDGFNIVAKKDKAAGAPLFERNSKLNSKLNSL